MRVVESIEIGRPLVDVRAFTADPTNDPLWITDVGEVRWLDPPDQVGSRAVFVPRAIGRLYRLPATLGAVDDASVTWRAESALLAGALRYDYAPADGGASFSVTFDARLALPLRPLDRAVAALLRRRLRAYLRTLRRRLESEPRES